MQIAGTCRSSLDVQLFYVEYGCALHWSRTGSGMIEDIAWYARRGEACVGLLVKMQAILPDDFSIPMIAQDRLD
jgi:hypothetical protein